MPSTRPDSVAAEPRPARTPAVPTLRSPVFEEPDPNWFRRWAEKHQYTLWTVFLGLLAVATVLGFGYLHYIWRGGQEPHRLLKMLVGAFAAGIFILRPPWALVLLPFAFPYVTWLPKAPIPMVNTLNILMASLIVGWIGRTLSHRTRFLEPSPWNRPVGLFLLWMVASWFWPLVANGESIEHAIAYAQYLWMATGGMILFFAIYNNIHTWKQVRLLAFLFCLGAGLGVLGLFHESAQYGGGRRVAGGLGQINVAGAFFATASLFVLSMFTAGFRRAGHRLILLASFVATIIGIVIPASRGAYVAFLAACVPRAFSAGIASVLILALVVGGVLVWAPDYAVERATKTQHAVSAESGSRYDALDEDSGGRLTYWRSAIEIIEEHPILGVGFARISLAIKEKLELDHAKVAHNLYLETAAEMGIPALVLLLWIFVTGYRKAGDLLQRPGFPRALGIGYRSALIALAVSNIFGGRFYEFQMSGTLALLTALVFRARQLPDPAPEARP